MQSLGSIALILVVGSSMAWAGSQGSSAVAGQPVFAIAVAASFLLNWIVFVPAYVMQTERYFDLTGSATYLLLLLVALFGLPQVDGRALLLASLVTLWALRLGFFLFRRIHASGGDGRFDSLKTNFLTFLMVWTLQGLWVVMTLSCVLAAITAQGRQPLGVTAAVGTLLWGLGFTIEVAADRQKSAFRRIPANRERFITSGLWAWSRHPNYFGEILLWLGLAVVAFPVLQGWALMTLVSPVFVWILLTRISGVPLLERRARKKWGGQPDFEAYMERTPVLFPLRFPDAKS